ncbi:hypothetical protein L484_003626 [Morus notabilis]|uniref:Uncharacterized protein n=1 Tax=Morus notabilis TaxID=981085 RepID=W9RBK9_9ROSA|nr:hypothetical protein L484_003626 [Morus notabilis]
MVTNGSGQWQLTKWAGLTDLGCAAADGSRGGRFRLVKGSRGRGMVDGLLHDDGWVVLAKTIMRAEWPWPFEIEKKARDLRSRPQDPGNRECILHRWLYLAAAEYHGLALRRRWHLKAEFFVGGGVSRLSSSPAKSCGCRI